MTSQPLEAPCGRLGQIRIDDGQHDGWYHSVEGIPDPDANNCCEDHHEAKSRAGNKGNDRHEQSDQQSKCPCELEGRGRTPESAHAPTVKFSNEILRYEARNSIVGEERDRTDGKEHVYCAHEGNNGTHVVAFLSPP